MVEKEKNRTRNKRATLRFSEEEYKLFKEKKAASNIRSYTDFVLRAILKVPIFVIDTIPILKVSAEISRVGNNINQIAKVANETGNIYLNDIKELQEKIDYINDIVTKYFDISERIKGNRFIELVISNRSKKI